MVEIQTTSDLTCPQCGHARPEEMPTDACWYFYDCQGCGVVVKPLPGDCCVFCSYGTVPCPPVQAGEACSLTPSSAEEGTEGPSSAPLC
ncbi:MAG: GDCCVxC domain-containing (seleno)protein [Alphaproteobacteria bacterium]|jgi:hypothetical protein|nr:GDCCVxC domain-containing (seleno)protein [Alphaproteobacteria bacterium]